MRNAYRLDTVLVPSVTSHTKRRTNATVSECVAVDGVGFHRLRCGLVNQSKQKLEADD